MPHKFNKSDPYDLRVMFQAFWNIQRTNSFVDIDNFDGFKRLFEAEKLQSSFIAIGWKRATGTLFNYANALTTSGSADSVLLPDTVLYAFQSA